SAAHRVLHSFPTRRSSDLKTFRIPLYFCGQPVGSRRGTNETEHRRSLDGGPPACDTLVNLYRVEVTVAHNPVDRAIPEHLDVPRSEEHTSELQSQSNLVCR